MFTAASAVVDSLWQDSNSYQVLQPLPMNFCVCIMVTYRSSCHIKSYRVRAPRLTVPAPVLAPFDIKTGTCSLRGKAQVLPFNERCSSSPCQQQCVTTTGWRHLVSLRGASAVKKNLQSCHFTLTDEPTWTGQEHRGHIMGPPVAFF